MKNPSVIAKEGIQAARQWVFRWRGLDGTPLRGLLALFITGSLFAIFAATVRIRVSAPQQWVERKASIIHLSSEGDGKMWALRAQEGGPFPSRVDPGEWEESSALVAATRFPAPPYRPALRNLPPENSIPPLVVTSKDERVFPKRITKAGPPSATIPTKLLPSLFPLDGISMSEMPAELPPFDAEVSAGMASADWRFLIRLQPDGRVSQCIPFTIEPGGTVLAKWLSGVNFTPAVAAKSEWIAMGVGFINQAVHGPDAR